MPKHKTVLIYGDKQQKRQYTGRYILEALKTIPDIGTETESRIEQLKQQVEQNPSDFKAALKELLEKAFSGHNEKHQAILMVVDDLEKLLIPPRQNSSIYSVDKDYQNPLIAIISAFKEANTQSRLILTTRYDFDLVDDKGEEISDKLFKLPLASMNETAANKQYRVKYGNITSINQGITLEPARVTSACQGNPGLQDLIFGLFIEEPENFQQTLQQMEHYLESGEQPEQQKVQDFLADLAIKSILKLLTEGEKHLLNLSTLFDIPVPPAVFDHLTTGLIKKDQDYKKDS